jgi:hypothetical protein
MAHQSFAIWDSCNKSHHGHNYSTSLQAETAQVHQDISVLYELRNSVLPEDQDLFCNSIDAHLLQPLLVLKGWLAINCKFILWSIWTAKIQAKTGTRPLSQYFTTCARHPHIPRPKNTTPIPPPRPSILTRLTCFFQPQHRAITLPSQTRLPQLPNPQQTPGPRQRRISNFFPDHPG